MTGTEACDTWCDYCGCCEHGESEDKLGCRAADAPYGMECPNSDCWCEGTMPYKVPENTCSVNQIEEEKQLHQELALF